MKVFLVGGRRDKILGKNEGVHEVEGLWVGSGGEIFGKGAGGEGVVG